MNKEEFQSLIKAYCCAAAKTLYKKDIKIFFEKDLGCVGIYRNEQSPPPLLMEGLSDWVKNPYASITFDDDLFVPRCWKEDKDRLWDYIIHEVTHIEVHVVCSAKWRISHPPKFYSVMRRNKKKIESLKKEFLEKLKEENKND